MGKSIDYASLSLMDTLDLAILTEEEAMERYGEFVDQMELHHTPDAAAFFRFMVENERKHGMRLAEKRQALFGNELPRMRREMLWDVEAPDYGEARAFMSPRQAMETALRSEVKAHEFYVRALDRAEDPDVRALFERLRDDELGHRGLIEKELAKLPPGPDIDPDDYADEPVAQ